MWPGNFEKLQLRQPKFRWSLEMMFLSGMNTWSDLKGKGFHASGGNSSDDLGCQGLLNKNGRGKKIPLQNKLYPWVLQLPRLKWDLYQLELVKVNSCWNNSQIIQNQIHLRRKWNTFQSWIQGSFALCYQEKHKINHSAPLFQQYWSLLARKYRPILCNNFHYSKSSW